MSDWLRKRVVLKEDIDLVKDEPNGNHLWRRKGCEGTCTADLPEENVFAVIFWDSMWVTFPTSFKDKFELLEGQ